MQPTSQHRYVSVIKVNGVPILPPVITPELRKELLNYQYKAIRLERHLENSSNETIRLEVDELQPSFHNDHENDDNSHIALLASNPPVHLSKDLIEVTEYNKDGLKIIENPKQVALAPDEVDCRRSLSPRPRLLRSNSYTLETPSPILLEHLKNEQSTCLSNARNWSSLDENSVSSKDTVMGNESNAPNRGSMGDPKTTSIEVYQTDISVQQITVNTTVPSSPGGKSREEKQCQLFTKDPFGVLEPDGELMKVLKDVPDEFAHRIIDLLRKQQVEQKQRLERYNEAPFAPDSSSHPEPVPSSSSTFSMSPSQSLYYSDSETQLNHHFPHSELNVKDFSMDKDESNEEYLGRLERDRAASVIGAAVRGYLTRRLIRTEKVQTLIGTVKEVLVCALELHHADHIDEKDVELHRRLINQLSAALHSFHGIFFDLSIEEQMTIIRSDRQRQVEKINRSQSSRSSSSNRLISDSVSLSKVERLEGTEAVR